MNLTQKIARAKVKQQGPLIIRRLRRDCPDCGHETLYCGERRFCGGEGHDVCVTAVCIRCGFEGSR
jgi:hypothetical protein